MRVSFLKYIETGKISENYKKKGLKWIFIIRSMMALVYFW
jgi:hypothetical protein